MAGYFAGNELALVKSVGIGQQQFRLADDERLAELVDIRLVFLLDALHDIDDGRFFLVRQEQCLVH